MAVKSSILDTLPYLRRFASAMAGSTLHGDFLVSKMLAGISRNVFRSVSSADIRIALFRDLVSVYDEEAVCLFAPSANRIQSDAVVRQRLAEMPVRIRKIFLLIVMERFSIAETATILGLSLKQAIERYDEALIYVSRILVTDVMILGSDPTIVGALRRVVMSLGHHVTERIGLAGNVLQRDFASKHQLVIVDFNGEEVEIDIEDKFRTNFPAGTQLISVRESQSVRTIYPGVALRSTISKPLVAHEIMSVVNDVLFFNR